MNVGRKDCRAGRRCEPANEAEALHCQGCHAQLPIVDVATLMCVEYSTLANWLNAHHQSRIPDDRKAELLRLTDDHDAYVHYLATLQGLVVFDPKSSRGRKVTRMVAEFGDVLKAFDEGSADGQWTPAEARKLRREADELHAAIEVEVREALIRAGVAEKHAGVQL